MRRRLPWAGLLLVACAETTARPGGPAPTLSAEDDLLAMVPAEADLVLWADLDKLRSSPWTRDSFDKVASAGPGTSSSFEQVRAVKRLVFAKVPSLGDGASLLVAQGGIDRGRLLDAFTAGGGTATATYRGAELVARGREALAFADRGRAVSGPTVAVRAALDCDFGAARAIDTESWFRRMRAELAPGTPSSSAVAALYVHLQPATRETLMQQMGEGDTLEHFAARVELGDDLSVVALGVVRTAAQARDLAGRLTERLRDASARPIVAAFGLGGVLEAIRLEARDTRVVGTVRVSASERAQIAERMAVVAETMARLRPAREESTR